MLAPSFFNSANQEYQQCSHTTALQEDNTTGQNQEPQAQIASSTNKA